MSEELNFNDDILDSLISNKPSYIELNDDNEFYFDRNDKEEIMDDEEFDLLLDKLGINNDSDDKKETIKEDISNDDFYSNRIKLEEEILNFERKKFEREKEEWEKYKKMSELSLKSERDEFERYREEEIKKLNLETKRILDNCENFRKLFEKYIKVFDVSE